MSEKDKLWLILNRASSGSDGDNTALSQQQARLPDKSTTGSDWWTIWASPANAAAMPKPASSIPPNRCLLSANKSPAISTQVTNMGFRVPNSLSNWSTSSQGRSAVARIGSRSSGGELKYTIRFDRLFRSDYEDDRKIEEAEKQKPRKCNNAYRMKRSSENPKLWFSDDLFVFGSAYLFYY